MTQTAVPVAITGLGVISSIGHDLEQFTEALKSGSTGIRSVPKSGTCGINISAPITGLLWPDWLEKFQAGDETRIRVVRKVLNNAPDSARLSAYASLQAFYQAGFAESFYRPEEIGLIVGGSNLHQRLMAESFEAFHGQQKPINPRYALNFWDSHQVGCLTEILSIRGMSCTVGGASASGNLALIQGMHWIRSGLVKACVVVGANSDFSGVEWEGLAILGALHTETDPERAGLVCRPFDQDHSGFVPGEGCAAVVLENVDSARQRNATIHGQLLGGKVLMDANHSSNPSLEGEAETMAAALEDAHVQAREVQYINAHGTSTPLGDRIEAEAIRKVFGDSPTQPWINSTKSFTGHCMGASAVLELVATLVQMKHGFLHANLNLDRPISSGLNFVGKETIPVQVSLGLSNSFGFGGFNSSIVVRKGNE